MADEGLQGRRALVTGASRGIGQAVAAGLAAAGASVVATARASAELDATVAAINEAGGQASCIPADLHDRAAVHRLADEAGEVDVLVHCAAAKAAYSSVLGSEDDDWDSHLTISLLALARLIRRLGPGMAERGKGLIVNFSSSAAVVPVPLIGPYAAAKRAAEWLTRLTAMELGPAGVRAVTIAPGLCATDVSEVLRESGQLENWIATTPAGRIASAQEVAGAVVWLAGDTAGYVSGTTWVIDGGHNAGEYSLFRRMATRLPAEDPLGAVGVTRRST